MSEPDKPPGKYARRRRVRKAIEDVMPGTDPTVKRVGARIAGILRPLSPVERDRAIKAVLIILNLPEEYHVDD